MTVFGYTFDWWVMPLIVTILMILWARFWPDSNHEGFLESLFSRFLMFVVGLVVSMGAWIAAGFMK